MPKQMQLAIVVSEFNYDITGLMLQRALEHAKFLNTDVLYVVKAPGAFDMPLLIQDLLEREEVQGVVTLGTVVQGDTKHDEIVMQHVARKMVDLAIQYRKPVGLGISGPGMTRQQGVERVDDYARRSVEAVVKLIRRRNLFAEVSKGKIAQYPVTIS